MAYRYYPRHPIAQIIFYGFWFYFLGQILDMWFGGPRRPWFLSAYYWTLGVFFVVTMILGIIIKWRGRGSRDEM